MTTARIHYPYTYPRKWKSDGARLLACEEVPLVPPVYAQRFRHTVEAGAQYTTDLDAVTCRACRRSLAFASAMSARHHHLKAIETRANYSALIPRRRRKCGGWRRAETCPCVRHVAAREARAEAVVPVKERVVVMSRTRPARVQPEAVETENA